MVPDVWVALGCPSGLSVSMRGMEDPTTPRFVQVPIPEDLVEDVFAFVTARRRELAGARPSATAVAPALRAADAGEWGADSLRAFLDRANPQLRTLLVHLAERAPDRVPAEQAMVAAGLKPGRSAGGFLSRANRSARYHFGLDVPLDGAWNPERGRNDYWVSEDNARVILDHAGR
jgi:hypothetical protein